METHTCILSLVTIIYLTSTTANSQTIEELAQRQYQLTIDTFNYMNEQIRVQQGELIERILFLEEKVGRMESAMRPRPSRRKPKPEGGSGRGNNGGATGDNGGGGGSNGKGGRIAEPTDAPPKKPAPVVTEVKVPTTTMKATTKMPTTTKIPTTTTVTTTKIPTTTPATTKMPTTTKIPTTTMTTTTKQPTTTMKTTTVKPTTIAPTTTIEAAPQRFEPTCHSIYRSGYKTSGDYTIDPDGYGSNAPFTVYCDMDNGEGVTIVGHDMEEQVAVNGFDDPGSFIVTPRYLSHGNELTMRQLGALTDASWECQQFVSYNCRGSALMNRDKKSGLTYAWWVDRYGVKHVNWGGAPTDSGLCACGITNSCFKGTSTCNCDHNKARDQTDEGFLDDRSLLPVFSLNLGDTGSKKERGAVTLGKFMCKG